MTKDAQMALRRVIEKYSRYTRFCLICNYASKIIPALQSRCTKFRFSPLDETSILSKMSEISEAEALVLKEGAKEAITRLSDGDMRRVLNLLQSCAMALGRDNITAEAVFRVAGKPSGKELMSIYHKLLNNSFNECVDTLESYRQQGLAVEDVVAGLYDLVIKTDLPTKAKCYLLEHLADFQNILAGSARERVQMCGLVGCFVLSRDIVGNEKMTVET